MSKSAIYTVNNSQTNLEPNAIIPNGVVVHRFGPNIRLDGQGITLMGRGYYKCDYSVTLSPTAIGTVSAQLYYNGQPLEGAYAEEYTSTANQPVNLSFSAIVRIPCACDEVGRLTIRLGDEAATLINMPCTVEKL